MMDKLTTKQLVNKCKLKKIKGYSSLNKKQLINKLAQKGGNSASCHTFDDNVNNCQTAKIKKNIQNYKCQFIVHNDKLSKCVRQGNLKKYVGYKIYSSDAQKIKKREAITIPDIDKKQIQTDLERYLLVNAISLYINDKPINANILKTESSFLKEIPNSKHTYMILKTLLSPGFHNDDTINTFKHCNFTQNVFKTKNCVDYVMCNVNIGKIEIKLTHNKEKTSLVITEYLKGNLQCMKNGAVDSRAVNNKHITLSWSSGPSTKSDKVLINYY